MANDISILGEEDCKQLATWTTDWIQNTTPVVFPLAWVRGKAQDADTVTEQSCFLALSPVASPFTVTEPVGRTDLLNDHPIPAAGSCAPLSLSDNRQQIKEEEDARQKKNRRGTIQNEKPATFLFTNSAMALTSRWLNDPVPCPHHTQFELSPPLHHHHYHPYQQFLELL